MTNVRSPARSIRPRLSGVVASTLVAMVVTGCIAGATEPGSTPSAAPTASASPTPAARSSEPAATTGPTVTVGPTTQTGWGTILDTVPDTFPRYPDAKTADPPSEPVSEALATTASVDDVATWYRDTLGSAGFTTIDLSNALEDGSRVLDASASAPGCRVQLTVRPLGGSTMITVLYGAGCVGAAG